MLDSIALGLYSTAENRFVTRKVKTMEMSRTTLALIAMVAFVPYFHFAQMSSKLGVRPEAMLVFWLAGVVVGIVGYSCAQGEAEMFRPLWPLLASLVLGLTIGTGGNIALSRSMDGAPNPGTYLAIINANAALLFITAPLVAWMWPSLTAGGEMAYEKLLYVLGITVCIAGLVR